MGYFLGDGFCFFIKHKSVDFWSRFWGGWWGAASRKRWGGSGGLRAG